MTMIDESSVVAFSLAIQEKDKEAYYIGNRKLNEYIEVPKEAVDVIRLFDGKRNVQQVIQRYNELYDEPVDILEFVQDLHELQMVYSIDGNVVGFLDEVEHRPIVKKIAGFLFNKVSVCIYLGLFFASLTLMLTHRHEILNTEYSVLFPRFFGISFLCYTLASWGIILFHELGHYFAAVSIDIPVRFTLNLRYLFLVVEADINGVWAVPKAKRYIVYLAGMCSDSVILFIALLGKFYFAVGNPLLLSVCNMVALVICLSFIQQLMLFARTDLYYVLLTALNVNGLYMYLRHFIRSHILRKEEKTDDYPTTYVAIFFIISIFGVVFACISTYYNFKIIFEYLYGGMQEILTKQPWMIIDGLCAVAVSVLNVVLWISGFKNYIRQYRTERLEQEEA